MKNVILFSGKAESGKTTAAKLLKELLEKEGNIVAIIPYGAYVKETAKLVFGWNGSKDENGRKLLQWWGTDVVRALDPDFWVDTLKRLAVVSDIVLDYLIIDDARFSNEVDTWPKENRITVRVERPGHISKLTDEQKNHPSETSLDDYCFDITLVASDYGELSREVNRLYERYFI